MKLVAFSGSLRQASRNSALLRHIASLSPAGVTVRTLSYQHLPLFNVDLIGSDGALPPEVETLRAEVAAADGVLFATPEFNYGIPGPLKNAIDWLSRPAYKSVFSNKPVATLTLSPSPVGGARAHGHLKAVLGGMAAAVMPAPEMSLGGEQAALSASGRPTHPKAAARVERWLGDAIAWTARLSASQDSQS